MNKSLNNLNGILAELLASDQGFIAINNLLWQSLMRVVKSISNCEGVGENQGYAVRGMATRKIVAVSFASRHLG